MTRSLLNILIVDDHPTMIEGYKSILSAKYNLQDEINITTAYNCETAYRCITAASKNFDIAIVDMILPHYELENLFSGEEVALLIQNVQPNCKIILSTSHTETFVLYNLIKNINPHGVLVKSDYTSEEFLVALNDIIAGESYYSLTARQSIKEIHLEDNYLDSYNRRIVSLLAKGIKTKNLPQHLNISMSAIDKRKAHIKEVFDIVKGTDEDIIREAKNRGFI
jgi:two-component system, NarL family, response regulator NreC